jgi:phosphatidylglycerophosphate synthase
LHVIAEQPLLQRVLILADESADWRVAGLRQLQRILLTLNECAEAADQRVPISVCVRWKDEPSAASARTFDDPRLTRVEVSNCTASPSDSFDLVLSTRVFLFRNSIAALLEAGYSPAVDCAASWEAAAEAIRISSIASAAQRPTQFAWRYLPDRAAIPSCERAFLRGSGKSQDGLVSRYLNRPISRTVSRLLLKTELMPNTWSVLIFALPIAACAAFVQGTAAWFILGCAIFQLYSILDGCDGEIARAKFVQTEFGRRLDSLLDLTGNMLLALCLGIGLSRDAMPLQSLSWFYIAEGIAAAACVVLSEGIVFLRRSRRDQHRGLTALNGALYHRHQEFFQRSGILVFGENTAWWIVFLTKRDMAMLAFVFLAVVGYPEWILHLLLGVGAVNSALAGNAFFRAPAPAAAVQQEAS